MRFDSRVSLLLLCVQQAPGELLPWSPPLGRTSSGLASRVGWPLWAVFSDSLAQLPSSSSGFLTLRSGGLPYGNPVALLYLGPREAYAIPVGLSAPSSLSGTDLKGGGEGAAYTIRSIASVGHLYSGS